MKIDIARFEELAARGAIIQDDWGDGRERACLMSALVTGATSEEDCAANGWPLWLAEMAVWLFDRWPRNEAVARGRALAHAIAAYDARGGDWDAVYRRVRMDAILPIAGESIGDGDELWRIECRAVVDHAISVGARPPTEAEAAWAAKAAWAAEAAWAGARDRIEEALLKALA